MDKNDVKIGFFGTKHGLTKEQKETIGKIFKGAFGWGKVRLYHCDRQGSDKEANGIFLSLGGTEIEKLPYLSDKFDDRMKSIMGVLFSVHKLVVAVHDESQKGGSWWVSTLAQINGINVAVIKPSGEMKVIKPATKISYRIF